MITPLLCRREDRGDIMNLVESDDEQIFQDAVPRLPPLTNGPQTTLVQIHRIPSSRLSAHPRLVEFHYKCLSLFFFNRYCVFKVTMRTQKVLSPARCSRMTRCRQKSQPVFFYFRFGVFLFLNVLGRTALPVIM